jgi:hypothetical protein
VRWAESRFTASLDHLLDRQWPDRARWRVKGGPSYHDEYPMGREKDQQIKEDEQGWKFSPSMAVVNRTRRFA